MAQVPHAVDHPAQILRDAAADIQGDHPIDQQPAQEPPAPALNNNIKSLVMWTLYACLMAIFRVGHVDPLYERYSELVMWTLYACFIKYSELVMWMLFACLIKVFRVGHGDPLCMFNKIFKVGHVDDTLFKIFRVGHVDPLCMFNKLFSELVMWTLYTCLI